MKRIERKHLKENELIHTIEAAREFVEPRKRQISGVLIALALIAVAAIGIVMMRQRSQTQGQDLLAEAMVALNARVVPAGARERIARLETLLENLRQELKIPAYSAAIVKDQKVLWAKGFGYADVENKIPATEHTPYHLASLTKTFASTILMQLVQEGKIKLDDPVSKYGITLESDGVIRVRHLFSHTSEGNPGEQYRYNGNRFAELDKVVEKATGKSFAELLIANILDPLGMNETAPNVPTMVSTKSPNAAGQAAETEVKAAVMDIVGGYNSGNVDQIERRLAPQQNRFQEGGFHLVLIVSELRGHSCCCKVTMRSQSRGSGLRHKAIQRFFAPTVTPAMEHRARTVRLGIHTSGQTSVWKLFLRTFACRAFLRKSNRKIRTVVRSAHRCSRSRFKITK